MKIEKFLSWSRIFFFDMRSSPKIFFMIGASTVQISALKLTLRGLKLDFSIFHVIFDTKRVGVNFRTKICLKISRKNVFFMRSSTEVIFSQDPTFHQLLPSRPLVDQFYPLRSLLDPKSASLTQPVEFRSSYLGESQILG